jgi:hypothetical protein
MLDENWVSGAGQQMMAQRSGARKGVQ